MFHVSNRTLTLAAVTASASFALAACGSPAIDTSGGPGFVSPSPSASASASASAPSQAASSTAPIPQPSASHATTGMHSSPAKSGSTRSGTTAPSAPTGGSGGTHTVAPTSATITVTPSTGLSDGQTVTIRGSHFDPSISVIIMECVDKGTNTQSTDCTGNGGLLGIPSGFKPGSDGTFTKTFVVHKSYSGIGGGNNTCGVSGPCIISVTEPTNNPTEEADAPISFR